MKQNFQLQREKILPLDARNAGIKKQYYPDEAAWISFPETQKSVVGEYLLKVSVKKKQELHFSISADQHYEFYIDDVLCGEGPDRCDRDHWSFASYHLILQQGDHTIRVFHQYLKDLKGVPPAYETYFPFFMFGVEEPDLREQFNTGSAPWKVRCHYGIDFAESKFFVMVKDPVIDVRTFSRNLPWQKPVMVYPPLKNNAFGAARNDHHLYPSSLEEQIHDFMSLEKARVRAVTDDAEEQHVYLKKETSASLTAPWQELLRERKKITLPPHSTKSVLIDMNDYVCGYPMLEVSGGSSEEISVIWTEALEFQGKKENRGQIIGGALPQVRKSDIFRNFQRTKQLIRSIWWQAGRYMVLKIKVGDASVTIHRILLRESRYPLEDHSQVTCSDERINQLLPVLRRTMQMCTHDAFMDCPYYEQLTYVGDSRLEALTYYMMHQDFSVPERVLSLFDWSRHRWEGIVAERYPSRCRQLSTTFCMIYLWMLRDLFLYRRPGEFLRKKFFTSQRCVINALLEYVDKEFLIRNLPGWSFVDWTVQWWRSPDRHGVPVGNDLGCTAVFQLQMIGALEAAAEMETFSGGESCFRERYLSIAEKMKEALHKYFWDKKRGMFSDDLAHKEDFSEHTQSMALLFHAVSAAKKKKVLHGLLTAPDLVRTSVYFSFYLMEALRCCGQADLIAEKMNWWFGIQKKGALTTWESPEPRSDCHAWGSHPLYHLHCSVAGIRPASEGFRTIRVEPSLGKLKYLRGKLVHPDGMIEYDFHQTQSGLTAKITLPAGVTGSLLLNGKEYSLKSGENRFN